MRRRLRIVPIFQLACLSNVDAFVALDLCLWFWGETQLGCAGWETYDHIEAGRFVD